ncbi:hypothetical protein ACEWPM_003890 [Roseovarius sp. S4756]|uniref:hypothetical protein n=1 Tax=Roseovarius maritimus TaxID=3342637 RepID=UPI003728CD65
MIRPIALAALATCLATLANAQCDIADCNPRDCEDYAIQQILPGFPAHVAETTEEQRLQISRIGLGLALQLGNPGAYECAFVMGHSSSWRGISADEYDDRAHQRARIVAEMMATTMETEGVVATVVAKEDLDGDAFCETTGEEQFVIVYDGRGNACPRVDNQVNSTTRDARNARFVNRRVELYLVPKGERYLVQIDRDAPCPDVISSKMLCVDVDQPLRQGVICSDDGWLQTSKEDLRDLVTRGEATVFCEPAE